jgi:hypothetical protein
MNANAISDALTDRAFAAQEYTWSYDEIIDDMASSYLIRGADYDPLTAQNMADALGDPETDAQKAMALKVQEAMYAGRFEDAARVLQELSWDYWEKYAIGRATKEVERQRREARQP